MFRTHILHVGTMDNKGTQALICSDVSVIKDAVNDSSISISTSDIPGVRKLGLDVNSILPSMVDIPLRRADQLCKRIKLKRGGIFYKLLTLGLMLMMPVQVLFSLSSVLLAKMRLRPFYRREIIESIKNSNLVISHSDENFKETASLLPLNPYWALTWWSILLSRTMDIVVARSLGKPVVLFPNSVGPFRTWIGKFLARLALNGCDYLMIREPKSYQIVNDLGIKTARILTYDTALLFTTGNQKLNWTFSRSAIGVCAGIYGNSLSKEEVEKYINAHAESLDAAIEKHNMDVVFLPHYVTGLQGDDLNISKLIQERMSKKLQTKIICVDNVADFKLLLDSMHMVISSKMHPAILAVTGNVPVLCIAYDHKQTAFFNRLHMSECLLHIREFSAEDVSLKIDYILSNSSRLKESLSIQISSWQNNVRLNIKKVLSKYNPLNS